VGLPISNGASQSALRLRLGATLADDINLSCPSSPPVKTGHFYFAGDRTFLLALTRGLVEAVNGIIKFLLRRRAIKQPPLSPAESKTDCVTNIEFVVFGKTA
jgi:hypothetical protein